MGVLLYTWEQTKIHVIPIAEKAQKIQTKLVNMESLGYFLLGQKRTLVGRVYRTGGHNKYWDSLWNIKTSTVCHPKLASRSAVSPSGFLLHNCWLHTAAMTLAQLDDFAWEVFLHPPNSHNRVQSDYHLFSHLNKFQWMHQPQPCTLQIFWCASAQVTCI